MKQLTEDQIKLLKSPLPKEAVKPHPTKSFLSSIKAIYVIERLNDVFGIGSWKLKSQVVDNSTAMIIVKSILTIDEYGIELESFGGNDNGGENSKNHDTGDAYKGAVTDALTKICSYLGIGMDVFKGLATTAKDPSQTTSYNHKQVATNGKPLISNEQFKKICARAKEGEAGIYEKTIGAFSLDETQDQLLKQLSKKALQTAN